MAKQNPVISKINQYNGINAHLNTTLQHKGWEGFHTYHIADIATVLNTQLEGTGYYADLESGLQIRHDEGPTRHPKADVLIADADPKRHTKGPTSFASREHLTTYDETILLTPADLGTEYYPAVGIYNANVHIGEDQPVTWIELLSPTNKKGGPRYREYLEKRETMINTGQCVYIEIDYLHEENSTPFRVAIIDKRPATPDDDDPHDPRPTLGVISFGVDEKIPLIPMPLYGGDRVDFDLDQAYQASFQRGIYGTKPNTRPNYAEFPVNVQRYRPADRARIARRMFTVMEVAKTAASQGLTLDAYLTQEKIDLPLPLTEAAIPESDVP